MVVHEYTPLLAFWAKPMPGLRFNFDWEHTNSDNAIVRIGPRKEARYRFQGNYTPNPGQCSVLPSISGTLRTATL